MAPETNFFFNQNPSHHLSWLSYSVSCSLNPVPLAHPSQPFSYSAGLLNCLTRYILLFCCFSLPFTLRHLSPLISGCLGYPSGIKGRTSPLSYLSPLSLYRLNFLACSYYYRAPNLSTRLTTISYYGISYLTKYRSQIMSSSHLYFPKS